MSDGVTPRVGELLPEGFHLVPLVLTTKEFEKVTKDWTLTAEGTHVAAVRKALGFPEKPAGLIKAFKGQRDDT